MKSRFLILSAVIFVAVFCIPSLGSATLLDIGGPISANSWLQGFIEENVGNYNKIEAFMMTPGVDFEAPGFSSFTAPGWTGALINQDYILGTGPGVISMTFNIAFTSAQSVPFTFDFFAWDGTTLREAAHAYWSGGGWTFAVFDPSGIDYDAKRTPVFEPFTMLFLVSSVLGLIGFSRKFKN